MKAIITVIGKDRVGIIAGISVILAEYNVNILDISQTVMQDIFTMIMMVDAEGANVKIDELQLRLNEAGEKMGLSVRLQLEEIFNAMHRL